MGRPRRRWLSQLLDDEEWEELARNRKVKTRDLSTRIKWKQRKKKIWRFYLDRLINRWHNRCGEVCVKEGACILGVTYFQIIDMKRISGFSGG
jgi:hypothetical protein